MCIGIPMRVREIDGGLALCEAPDGGLRRVNALLVAEAVPGDMLLVHVDSAVRRLDEDEARAIGDAVQALSLAMQGENVDHLFADLIDRTPELPAHLREATGESIQKEEAS